MSETGGTEGQSTQDSQQMSEEQVEEYKARLRSAPAEQVLTEILGTVLHAGEVKLGRRDARLMIDLSSVILDQVREYISDELTSQVERALGQLRYGQVSAEKEASNSTQAEENDLERAQAAPSEGEKPRQDETSSARSKLWVPGQ